MRRNRWMSLAVALGVALLMSFPIRPVGEVANAQKPDTQPVIARITIKSQREMEQLITLELDLLEMREGNDLFILTTPEQVRQLRAQGWSVAVDKQQTAILQSQWPGADRTRAVSDSVSIASFMGGYRTVPEIRAFVDDRAARYPDLAEAFVYGSSWEKLNLGGTAGHDLFGIKLTNKLRPGPKPTLFLMAAIHARELSVSELALRFVDHLLNGYGVDADATWLLDEHLIVVVPVVNPDGRRLAEQGYFQRKNTNPSNGGGCANPPTSTNQFGVDLNRNYDFKWGTVNTPGTNPCAQTYPGPFTASEPETALLQNLIRSLFPDQRGPLDTDAAPPTTTGLLITLHSYSDLVMWPWGHSSASAPNSAGLALIGRKFAGYNGYTPQQSIQLYATSGTTDDWSYGELGIPSYTFEVGLSSGACGGFMPPYSCLDGGTGGSFWPRNLPAFLYAARIASAPYQLAQGPTTETLTATRAVTGQVELRAQLDEQRNGGQQIVLAEYYIDIPPWRGGTPFSMSASDGSFNSTAEVATATVGTPAGSHILYVRGRDENGNWGAVRAVFTPPESCSYSLNPTGQSFAPNGGTGSVAVNAEVGCSWTASSGASWLTITSGGSGSGNGTVNYTVAANGGTSSRSGTLTVAGQTLTLTQEAVRLNTLSLNPTTVTGAQTSTGTVTLTHPAPTGGTVVTLSSSNTAAATVPSSITVTAGATSRIFTVTPKAVATTSTVNISATYGGLTRTAALTIVPLVAAPGNLAAVSISSRQINLTWADNSNNESGFLIERCRGTGCTNFTQTATVGANVTSFQNTGLSSGKTYGYRVRANNSAGNSLYSNLASARTQ